MFLLGYNLCDSQIVFEILCIHWWVKQFQGEWRPIVKVLETERLILRSWRVEDLDDFYEYASNENVGPHAGWEPHPSKETSLQILKYFMEKNEVWAIVLKGNHKVVGSIGAHCDEKRSGVNATDIGYALAENYWGKGLMPEALQEVIRFLFEEKHLEVISCSHHPGNDRSKRVIEKCGFKYEGTIRCASKRFDGKMMDDVCYSILREEFCFQSSIPLIP
ncbi:TPA: GNAT family N-acetyltransferase [Candidatus Sumerlaeota bacterium]|nr:GNAT family N-acetyltransferase [Candidatus Sumerlaeota bacterium]